MAFKPRNKATRKAVAAAASGPRPHALLDALIERLTLKNDAALSRLLKVEAPTISKIRNGRMGVGPSMLLRMHEVSQVSVGELRAWMAAPSGPVPDEAAPPSYRRPTGRSR